MPNLGMAKIALIRIHQETLGQRIIEMPEDLQRTELRDDASGFVAYVPVDSVVRVNAWSRRARLRLVLRVMAQVCVGLGQCRVAELYRQAAMGYENWRAARGMVAADGADSNCA
jgi:Tfp pilus assembly pilus retraction ATPase PilT